VTSIRYRLALPAAAVLLAAAGAWLGVVVVTRQM